MAPRTFLMLAATVSCGAAIYQIRIRNVSETGALIEGADLPEAGQEILLSRGQTEIDAIVAWASGSRRGVHFSRPVAVDTWRAGKPATAPPISQTRVDRIQAAPRAEVRLLAKLVKGAAQLSYWGDDALMLHVGYDADANVRRGRELRLREGRP